MDERDLELHAHRIAANEAAILDLRNAHSAAMERILTKLDMLLEVKLKYETTWNDLQNAWRVIHELEKVVGTLRDIPGIKAALYGSDGGGGLTYRAQQMETAQHNFKRQLDGAIETADERLDPVELALYGKEQNPGLMIRVDRLESDGRFFRRVLMWAGGGASALMVWLIANLGEKLKAIFFHGP